MVRHESLMAFRKDAEETPRLNDALQKMEGAKVSRSFALLLDLMQDYL